MGAICDTSPNGARLLTGIAGRDLQVYICKYVGFPVYAILRKCLGSLWLEMSNG